MVCTCTTRVLEYTSWGWINRFLFWMIKTMYELTKRFKVMDKVGVPLVAFQVFKKIPAVVGTTPPPNCIFLNKTCCLKPVWNQEINSWIRPTSIWNPSSGWVNRRFLKGAWRWAEATSRRARFNQLIIDCYLNQSAPCLSRVEASSHQSPVLVSSLYVGVRLVFRGSHASVFPSTVWTRTLTPAQAWGPDLRLLQLQ